MSIFIDAHVHIQPGFDLNIFFDNAWINFSNFSKKSGKSIDDCSFVLLLTESHTCNVFNTLALREENDYNCKNSEWQFYSTREKNSLIATNQEKNIYIIAGRQLVSTENIELLSLFSPLNIQDRSLPLKELAIFISDNGGLALIPWGVGKWLGRRGKIVEAFLQDPPSFPLLVGDNGNRPELWPYPALLSAAEEKSITSLAGSDPLQFTSHARRAGTRGGFLRDETLEHDTPAQHLQNLLQSTPHIESFGKGVGFFRFVCDQLRANAAKRM